MRYARLGLILLILSTAALARAEEIHLKDGNRVTGAFERLLGGNVVVKTDSLGTLTIPVANVESFTSSTSMFVILKDGKTEEGVFSLKAGVWQLQSAAGVTTTLPAGEVLAVYPAKVYEKENPKAPRKAWQDWKGQGSLGYVLQQSSQHSRSLSINFNSARVEPRLEGLPPRRSTVFSFNMAFATLTESGVTTSSNTLTSLLRQNFFFGGDGSNYLFLQGQWDHIQPQELNLRQSYGGGIGRDLIRRPDFTLGVHGGLTYVRSNFTTGEMRNEMEALAGERITATVFKHLNINHAFDVYPNLTSTGDYRFNAIIGLDAPISSRFSFNITATDQYLSNPIPGTDANVLILSTGLGVNF